MNLPIVGFSFLSPFFVPRNGVFAVELGKTPFRGDKKGGGKASNAAPEALEMRITHQRRLRHARNCWNHAQSPLVSDFYCKPLWGVVACK